STNSGSTGPRGFVDPGGRSYGGGSGGSDTSGGGPNSYAAANGPSATGTTNVPRSTQKNGDITASQTTSSNANVVTARICALPAGTWCPSKQGDVGAKCSCPDNNGGRGSDGVVK